MNSILILFSDYTFQIVAVGSAILGIVSGVLGCFAVQRKQSLLGDGISHSTLLGVVLAFLITGAKETEVLLVGALITGLLSAFVIMAIVKYSRIKFDSALAMTLSVFFGIGTALLTYSQKIPNSNQAGLSNFIYGQASTMVKKDVYTILIVGFVVLLAVFLLWKELKLLTFDPDYLHTIGYPTGKLNVILLTLTVTGIVIGLQTVGVILMSAMLIAPSVGARQWVNKFSSMLVLSAIFGAVSGITGTAISSCVSKLSTGPIIVVCASIISLFSVLFAPKRGVISKIHQRKKAKKLLKKGEIHNVGRS